MLDSFIQQLNSRDPLPPLIPKTIWQPQLSQQILAADFGDNEMASAIRAGLLLWNDDLENAHSIVQSPERLTNNFWHAILHRREGDFPNSIYWFRRVGEHPAFADIHQVLEEDPEVERIFPDLLQNETWNPIEFVRLCENADNDEMLREIQLIEIEMLLSWCIEHYD